MPGFFDKLKSGADKAAFEADRLRRVTQAQSALRGLQRDLDEGVVAIGRQALAMYDAGTLSQPELLALFPPIDTLRQRIAAQEAEVERIRQEKPPEAAAPPQERAPVAPAAVAEKPAAAPESELHGHSCPNCQKPLPADVKFCPDCGSKVVDA